MRTRDLEAWKKEFEFCHPYTLAFCSLFIVLVGDGMGMGWQGTERTWRSRENGKQDLKVALLSMEVMNALQLAVILLLNPVSKGVGKLAAALVVAATIALDVVVVGASVADELLLVFEFGVEEDEEELLVDARRRRSGSSLVCASSSAGEMEFQRTGSGGGR